MKRYSINTIVAAIVSATVLTACSGDQSPQTKQVDPVKVGLSRPVKRVTNAIHTSGKVESSETATISTRMMGHISSINVKPGDKVMKGQLLITLNNNDVLAKRGQAEAMIVEAQAALRDAQKDLDRYKELYQQQSASTKELENITLHYESVKSKAEAARQMKLEADAMLAYTNIVAPFSGIVTQKYATEGSLASPGAPLLVVEQLGVFQVTTSVDESEIGNVMHGVDADITVKSTGKIIKGKVSEISPSANPGGRYTVKISLNAEEAKGLYSGMIVNAVIASATSNEDVESIVVPYRALVQKDQLVGIYTVSENNTALLRWIKPGRTFGNEVEVLSGINENESFISSSESRLYNGVPVHAE
jgi:RND family efflux transporter MFP subunit